MKRSRILAFIASILCMAMLLPSCNKLHKKTTTERTEETDDTEETGAPIETQPSATMIVTSLDQFISDGGIFSEDVKLPTPTPIPYSQLPIGLTNDDDGYFSGPLVNASIVDNEFFRYTIISTEVTQTSYIVNAEFENKTDEPYSLVLLHPAINNCSCAEYRFVTEVIEPHTVLQDTTDFAQCFPDFDGTEPNRIAFLLKSNPVSSGLIVPLFDSERKANYVPCVLFPQGEENFSFQDREEVSGSSVLYDSEVGQFTIDSFEVSDGYLVVNYSYLNKSPEYVMLSAGNDQVLIDDYYFDIEQGALLYIPPYSRQTKEYYVRVSDLENNGIDPSQVRFISIDLEAKTLYYGILDMWNSTVRGEIVFG